MSYVTTFDVPHILAHHGMIDEHNGETRQLFYRCATVFSVTIKRKYIKGTPFEREWSKYCVEDLKDPRDHFKRWEQLLDLVVGQILPKLQELAPADGSAWKTFQDYLKPKTYTLRLIKDSTSGDAVAELMDGPSRVQSSLPYDLMPQRWEKLTIPEDLPRIQASEISIVDHAENWLQKPQKAQITESGEVAALIPASSRTEAVETGKVRNRSLEAMAKMLELWQVKEDINVTKPLAVVTAKRAPETDVEIAGILYLGVPDNAKRLADMTVDELKDAHSRGLTEFWKDQIKQIVDVLGSYNITHGAVHQYHIWIDSDTSAWLDCPSDIGDEAYEGDLERLDMVFDFWLKRRVDSEQKKLAEAV